MMLDSCTAQQLATLAACCELHEMPEVHLWWLMTEYLFNPVFCSSFCQLSLGIVYDVRSSYCFIDFSTHGYVSLHEGRNVPSLLSLSNLFANLSLQPRFFEQQLTEQRRQPLYLWANLNRDKMLFQTFHILSNDDSETSHWINPLFNSSFFHNGSLWESLCGPRCITWRLTATNVLALNSPGNTCVVELLLTCDEAEVFVVGCLVLPVAPSEANQTWEKRNGRSETTHFKYEG